MTCTSVLRLAIVHSHCIKGFKCRKLVDRILPRKYTLRIAWVGKGCFTYKYILALWGGDGEEIIFSLDFGIYLSIITSVLLQSSRFHTSQTYTPSNDGYAFII